MSKDIKTLIERHIQGQASQVDLDSKLPEILGGIIEEIPTPEAIPVEYGDLLALYKAGELQPGAYYRIKDYTAVTFQENTKSAGHKFDIIVQAIDSKTLSEEAQAAFSDTDPYFEDAGVKIGAWKLWYSIDNNDPRFSWAHPTSDQLTDIDCDLSAEGLPSALADLVENNACRFRKTGGKYIADLVTAKVTASECPYIGCPVEILYEGEVYKSVITNMDNGSGYAILPPKGVVYRLIDEWNNDCPYDFKNILFKRWGVDTVSSDAAEYMVKSEYQPVCYATRRSKYNTGNGITVTPNPTDFEYYYTFTWLNTDNKAEDASIVAQYIPDDGGMFSGVHDNKMLACALVDAQEGQTILAYKLNAIVFASAYELDDGYFYGYFNISCGSGCYDISCGSSCFNISFGDYCYAISCGSGCYAISCGDYCHAISFGEGCFNISCGDYCYAISFGDYCYAISCGSGCYDISCGSGCYNISCGSGCFNISCGSGCYDISCGGDCSGISLGNYCSGISLGSECYGISLGSSETNKMSYVRYVEIENGNRNLHIVCSASTSGSAYCQNVHVALGVNNSNTYKTLTVPGTNLTHETRFEAAGSQVIEV